MLVIVLLAVLLLVSSTSPFWHIELKKGLNDGVFGFTSFRTFLYSFGTHFILFGASLFFFWVLHLIPNINDRIKRIKRIGTIGAIMYCSVSIYYLLFIFINTSNSPYPDFYYEIGFILMSLLSSFTIYKAFGFFEKISEIKNKKQQDLEEFLESGNELVNLLKTNS